MTAAAAAAQRVGSSSTGNYLLHYHQHAALFELNAAAVCALNAAALCVGAESDWDYIVTNPSPVILRNGTSLSELLRHQHASVTADRCI